jgi:uncharacterized protein YjiS (DUF1127 family)
MFETSNPPPQSSSFELEHWARRERNLVISALVRSAIHKFARWLRVLFVRTARMAHGWAAGHLRRQAIRALERLDDRTLADIGVPRCDIESVVRSGRPARAAGKALRRQDRSRRPARRRVA